MQGPSRRRRRCSMLASIPSVSLGCRHSASSSSNFAIPGSFALPPFSFKLRRANWMLRASCRQSSSTSASAERSWGDRCFTICDKSSMGNWKSGAGDVMGMPSETRSNVSGIGCIRTGVEKAIVGDVGARYAGLLGTGLMSADNTPDARHVRDDELAWARGKGTGREKALVEMGVGGREG